jgi:hypothetical protein
MTVDVGVWLFRLLTPKGDITLGRERMARYEDEEDVEETFVHADIPNTFRELRACMTCSLVKTFTQFYDTGCENCQFLQMADNRQRVADCTSAHYEGCVRMRLMCTGVVGWSDRPPCWFIKDDCDDAPEGELGRQVAAHR